MVTFINGEDLVLGRMASAVAKRVIKGEEIVIVNAERVVILGEKYSILREYRSRREKGSQRKGPYYPRMPDKIVRRTVRGMIPYQKPRGKVAYKRLKVYIGIPDEFKNVRFETIEGAKNSKVRNFIRVGDVSAYLGANVR